MGDEARDTLPALIEALKDKDEEVRCIAADTLAEFGPDAKAAVPTLAGMLRDKEVGPHAARCLAHIGREAKAAIPALVEAAQEEDVMRAPGRQRPGQDRSRRPAGPSETPQGGL